MSPATAELRATGLRFAHFTHSLRFAARNCAVLVKRFLCFASAAYMCERPFMVTVTMSFNYRADVRAE